MKFNTIFGLALLLTCAAGENIIAYRSFGSYVHNARCPTFHHNDTTIFHVNPEMAKVQLYMGKEKQMLAPYIHADEILKKSSYIQ